jgi:hypothetical protein
MANPAPLPPAPPASQSTIDIVWLIIGLFFFAALIQKIPLFLQEEFGIDIGSPYLIAGLVVSSETPLGTEVMTPYGAEYFKERGGGGDPLGVFSAGTELILKEGPETLLQNEWWFVQSKEREEKEGWVEGSKLIKSGMGGFEGETPYGSNAKTLIATPLWRSPGGIDSVGEVEKGTEGIIIEGPRYSLGGRWWFFDTKNSVIDGWVSESVLLRTDTGSGWHRGRAVVLKRDADLFDGAGGGIPTAFVEKNTEAFIVGGPRERGNILWWEISPKNTSLKGWVPQDALKEGGAKKAGKTFVGFFIVLTTLLTFLLLFGIIYATIRNNALRARKTEALQKRMTEKMGFVSESKEKERWKEVRKHIGSDNPNEWRLAIIEADVMLDELVSRMPFEGTTLGERLKNAHRNTFSTLDLAWEAHRVRNNIAHSGSAYSLSKRDAEKTIAQYEAVFREFGVL